MSATGLSWWRRILCRWLCPRFEEDMPKDDEPGEWVACALLRTYCGRSEISTVSVTGLKNAYEIARWLALKLDFTAPSRYGVDWAVRRPKP